MKKTNYLEKYAKINFSALMIGDIFSFIYGSDRSCWYIVTKFSMNKIHYRSLRPIKHHVRDLKENANRRVKIVIF